MYKLQRKNVKPTPTKVERERANKLAGNEIISGNTANHYKLNPSNKTSADNILDIVSKDNNLCPNAKSNKNRSQASIEQLQREISTLKMVRF